MSAEIEPEAWIVDDTGFPKFGKHVGRGGAPVLAARWARSVTARSGCRSTPRASEASCPLDWRLFMPEEWDEDSESTAAREGASCREDVHRPRSGGSRWR